MSLPSPPLRLLPTAATFVGWDSHPLKFRAFSRRTMDGQDKQDKDQVQDKCSRFRAKPMDPYLLGQRNMPVTNHFRNL